MRRYDIFFFLAAKSPAELGKTAAVALSNYKVNSIPSGSTAPVRSTTIGLHNMASNHNNNNLFYTSIGKNASSPRSRGGGMGGETRRFGSSSSSSAVRLES